jgi:transposase
MQRDAGRPDEPELLGGPQRSGGETSNSGSNPTPDSEVRSKATRRRFTAKYKLMIVERADKCTKPGEVGALLRKEGLFSSQLAVWRKQRDKGAVSGLSRKRGRRSTKSPLLDENKVLRQQVDALQRQLKKAEMIIDVQKKLSEILAEPPSDENNGPT